jgi:hypothetical protein
MRARSHTEVDTRQHSVPLRTCLPSQTELDIAHQRNGHVSWMKRYYLHFSFLNTHVLMSSNP